MEKNTPFSPFSVIAGSFSNILVTTLVVVGGIYVGFVDTGSLMSLAFAGILALMFSSLLKKEITGKEFNMVQVIGSAGGILFMPAATIAALIVSGDYQSRIFEVFIISTIGIITALGGMSHIVSTLDTENEQNFQEAKKVSVAAISMSTDNTKKTSWIWLFLIIATVFILFLFYRFGEVYTLIGFLGPFSIFAINYSSFALNYSAFISTGIIFSARLVYLLIFGAIISVPYMLNITPIFMELKLNPIIPIVLLFVPSGIIRLVDIILDPIARDGIKKSFSANLKFIISFHVLSSLILYAIGLDWKLAIIAQPLAMLVGWLSAYTLGKTNNNVLNIFSRLFMLGVVLILAPGQYEVLLLAVYIAAYSYALTDFSEDSVSSKPFGLAKKHLIQGKLIGIFVSLAASLIIIVKLMPIILLSMNTTDEALKIPMTGVYSYIGLSSVLDFPVSIAIWIVVCGFIWELGWYGINFGLNKWKQKYFVNQEPISFNSLIYKWKIYKFEPQKWIPSTSHIALGAMLMNIISFTWLNLVTIAITSLLLFIYQRYYIKNEDSPAWNYPIAIAVGALLFKTIAALFLGA